MEVQYFKRYSYNLNRDMEFKVYGHAGRPVLYIPCQDGRFFDFENFKMTYLGSMDRKRSSDGFIHRYNG